MFWGAALPPCLQSTTRFILATAPHPIPLEMQACWPQRWQTHLHTSFINHYKVTKKHTCAFHPPIFERCTLLLSIHKNNALSAFVLPHLRHTWAQAGFSLLGKSRHYTFSCATESSPYALFFRHHSWIDLIWFKSHCQRHNNGIRSTSTHACAAAIIHNCSVYMCFTVAVLTWNNRLGVHCVKADWAFTSSFWKLCFWLLG